MLTNQQFIRREREVFTIARELADPADRAYYLAELEAQDPILAARVKLLLQASDTPVIFLDLPSKSDNESQSASHSPGSNATINNDVLTAEMVPSPNPVEDPLVRIPGFEIEKILGRGGMSVVYQAQQSALKRTVALKMMVSSVLASPDQRARFRIEAEAVARLQHPNIVQIHEVGDSGGYPYCALEYVEGGTLSEKLGGKPMPIHEAAKLVETLARAMQLAHSRNVVHRDLKPSNIMMTTAGVPKITDFGLARQLDRDVGVTHTGMLMGTPSYMAPEQASGHGHEAGPAADVYALGAILYDCVTGQPPFQGTTLTDILDQVRLREPASPSRLTPDVPIDLETICLKCLRKEPEKRYASALELAEELARFQTGEPIFARPIGNTERTLRWMKRNPTTSSLIGAVTALVIFLGVGGVIAGLMFSKQAQEQKQLAEIADRARTKAEDEQAKAVAAAELARNEAERATQVTTFLQGLFEPRDQLAIGFLNLGFQKKQSGLMANDLLKAGVEKLNGPGGLKDRPIVRAELLYNIGTIYMGMGQFGEAQPLLEEALQLRRVNLPANHLDLARSIQAVADIQSIVDSAAAAQLYAVAIEILNNNPEANRLELALIETRFALLLWYLNTEVDEPKRLLQHAYEIRRKHFGEDHLETIGTQMVLALIFVEANQKPDALKLILRMMPSMERIEGNPEFKEFGRRLIASMQTTMLFGEKASIESNRKLLSQTILVFGEDHFITIRVRYALAYALHIQDDTVAREEAIQLFSKCLQSLKNLGIPSHYWEANYRFARARCHWYLGRSDVAIPELRKTVELFRSKKDQMKNRASIPHALCDLALLLQQTADPKFHDEISELEEEAYAYCQTNPKVSPGKRGFILMNVAHWRMFRGEYATSVPLLQEAATYWGQASVSDHFVFEAEAYALLYYAFKQQGRVDEADTARKAAQRILDAHPKRQEGSLLRAKQLLKGILPPTRH